MTELYISFHTRLLFICVLLPQKSTFISMGTAEVPGTVIKLYQLGMFQSSEDVCYPTYILPQRNPISMVTTRQPEAPSSPVTALWQ